MFGIFAKNEMTDEQIQHAFVYYTQTANMLFLRNKSINVDQLHFIYSKTEKDYGIDPPIIEYAYMLTQGMANLQQATTFLGYIEMRETFSKVPMFEKKNIIRDLYTIILLDRNPSELRTSFVSDIGQMNGIITGQVSFTKIWAEAFENFEQFTPAPNPGIYSEALEILDDALQRSELQMY